MYMEITAHGFAMRRTLRADVEHEIGRLVQALQRPIKCVAVDLSQDRQPGLRTANKHCRVQVEFLNGVCETATDAEQDLRVAVSEAFLKLLRLPSH